MDKRKAYAIANPVLEPDQLREGHRRRVDHRFSTVLFCDGTDWVVRVEYLDFNFRPQRLGQMAAGGEQRMVEVAERVLVGANCGDGKVELAHLGPYTLEGRRAMMPAEQRAIHCIGAAAAG